MTRKLFLPMRLIRRRLPQPGGCKVPWLTFIQLIKEQHDEEKDYVETVTVAVRAVIEKPQIMTLMTERCGFAPTEFPPMLVLIEPAKTAAPKTE